MVSRPLVVAWSPDHATRRPSVAAVPRSGDRGTTWDRGRTSRKLAGRGPGRQSQYGNAPGGLDWRRTRFVTTPEEKDETTMNTTTQKPTCSKRQRARLFALGGAAILTLLGLAAFDRAAAGDTDGVYAWQGQGAYGRLNDPRFRTTLKKEFPGQNPVIQLSPSKSDILNNLPGKGVVYTNSHGGWSPPDQKTDSMATKEDLLRTGPPGTPDNAITAQDLLALRNRVGDAKMPGLMAIGGCDVLKQAPPGSNPLTIADALGVSNNTQGRALIAFDQKIVGPGADDFMLWVLDNWCHRNADGKYPTLQEAMDSTMTLIEDYQAAHKDDPAYQYGDKQKDDFMGGNAHYLGEHVKLIGDPNLKATDVLKGLPTESGDKARSPSNDNSAPSPNSDSSPSPGDNPPPFPSPAPSASPADSTPASPSPSDSETVPLSTPPSPVPSPSPSSTSALPGDDSGSTSSPGTVVMLPRYFPGPLGAPLPPWGRGYYHGGGYYGGHAGMSGYRGCAGGCGGQSGCAGGCGGQSGGGCAGGAGGSGCVGGSAGGAGFSGNYGGSMGRLAGLSGQMSSLTGKVRSGNANSSANAGHPRTSMRVSPPQRGPEAAGSSRVGTLNPRQGTKGLPLQNQGHPNSYVGGKSSLAYAGPSVRRASLSRASTPATRSVGRPTATNKAAAPRATSAASRTPNHQAAKPAPKSPTKGRAPAARPAPAQRRASPASRAPSTRAANRAPRQAAPRASSSAGRSGGSRRR